MPSMRRRFWLFFEGRGRGGGCLSVCLFVCPFVYLFVCFGLFVLFLLLFDCCSCLPVKGL